MVTMLFPYFLEESSERFCVLCTLVIKAESGLLDSMLCSYSDWDTASWYSFPRKGSSGKWAGPRSQQGASHLWAVEPQPTLPDI